MTEVPVGAPEGCGGFAPGTAGRAWLVTAGYAVVVAVPLFLLGGGHPFDADAVAGACATVDAAVLGFAGLLRGRCTDRSGRAGPPLPSARPQLVVVAVLTAATGVCAAVGAV